MLNLLLSQLRHLAGLERNPSTPQRRASSVGAPVVGALSAKSCTSGARWPLQAPLTTRNNPVTPHAIRALLQRRATPGRDRRKSGRTQRETPRDALRNLSKSRFQLNALWIELIAKYFSSGFDQPTISSIAT